MLLQETCTRPGAGFFGLIYLKWPILRYRNYLDSHNWHDRENETVNVWKLHYTSHLFWFSE